MAAQFFASRDGDSEQADPCEPSEVITIPSRLRNWPVQLRLVPTTAPYFNGARLLIAADCAPFAFADFHRQVLAGRVLLIGCPKLDDTQLYVEKLTEILRDNDIAAVEVAFMEVPCCFGLVRLVSLALQNAGKPIPLHLTKISIRGSILETKGPFLLGQPSQSDAAEVSPR